MAINKMVDRKVLEIWNKCNDWTEIVGIEISSFYLPCLAKHFGLFVIYVHLHNTIIAVFISIPYALSNDHQQT